MIGIGSINLKVVIFDSDIYALQAINSYLAWDRRTRVTFMTTELGELWRYLHEATPAELPDVLVLDVDNLDGLVITRRMLQRLSDTIPGVLIVCMTQSVDPLLVALAFEMGVRAFLLKQEVRMQIAWAIVYALEQSFLVTATVARITKNASNQELFNATVLPEQREYPEMTGRIRQAIRLCVIEGMPAHLAADEMAISLHTIRGYIKEGYRILESYDRNEYPTDMTPQERAFMRFTALAVDE